MTEPLIIALGHLRGLWHIHVVSWFLAERHVLAWSLYELTCCCQRRFYSPPLRRQYRKEQQRNKSVAVDEFHEHETRAVWDVLWTATGARREKREG